MNEVLLVSIGFSPNVGGIETHFDDLVGELDKKGWKTWVLTYKPLTTDVSAKPHEHLGKNIEIYRLPILKNIFYSLVKTPLLEFIFLVPGIFLYLPVLLITKCKNVRVIHSHGLIAGFVSVFWGKAFGKRVITTTHSIYNFPKNGLYRKLAWWIFGKSDHVLTLSKQSKKEIESLGVKDSNITVFTYWIDLKNFKPVGSKDKAKKKLKWSNRFNVLFVGRLVEEKGVVQLLNAAKIWDKNIKLYIAGTGPLEGMVRKEMDKNWSIAYLGKLAQTDLPQYYHASDLLIVPSVHEEGFGRVILESLACGTPVLGSERGAIPEAIDKSIGKLFDVTPENIKKEVEYFYKNPGKLNRLSKNARKFALKKYSEKNVDRIIKTYTE